MTQRLSLRSGTPRDKNATTALHQCTTEEHKLLSLSMTSPIMYVILIGCRATTYGPHPPPSHLQDTFVRAKSWVKELQRQANPNIVIALAGNKADLASKRMVDFEVGINWSPILH